jgi:hypothetical protein
MYYRCMSSVQIDEANPEILPVDSMWADDFTPAIFLYHFL